MLSYLQLIKNYGIDIAECDDVSSFELIATLVNRDKLEESYDNLSGEEKDLLISYDKLLLDNAKKFYDELSKVYSFNNSKQLTHWWAHIDKVVSGELIVDLEKREVRLSSEQADTKSAY